MVNKTVLGLDVGNRRVGVALANTTARIASPLTTIDRKSDDIWRVLDKLIKSNDVDTVVIGLPRNMSGEDTEQTAIVRQFVEDFKQHFTQEVHLQDEAVTSVMAEEELRARGGNYSKADIDALSATYILTDYLNENHQEADNG